MNGLSVLELEKCDVLASKEGVVTHLFHNKAFEVNLKWLTLTIEGSKKP